MARTHLERIDAPLELEDGLVEHLPVAVCGFEGLFPHRQLPLELLDPRFQLLIFGIGLLEESCREAQRAQERATIQYKPATSGMMRGPCGAERTCLVLKKSFPAVVPQTA